MQKSSNTTSFSSPEGNISGVTPNILIPYGLAIWAMRAKKVNSMRFLLVFKALNPSGQSEYSLKKISGMLAKYGFKDPKTVRKHLDYLQTAGFITIRGNRIWHWNLFSRLHSTSKAIRYYVDQDLRQVLFAGIVGTAISHNRASGDKKRVTITITLIPPEEKKPKIIIVKK